MQELVSDPLTLEATSKFEEVLVCVCARARVRAEWQTRRRLLQP